VNKRAREADAGGTTTETWPLPRLPSGKFPSCFFRILQIVVIVV
jgi:hypothetical protein